MESQKHSGLGIASFITSIVSAIFIFMTLVVAGVVEIASPGGMDEASATAVIIGLFLIVFVFASLVALGLGFGGIFQKERKKIFSILGIVFSIVTLMCTTSVMLIGLIAA